MKQIEIKSYAKINLSFEILKKISDYHEIHSLFQAIELYDTITISESEEYSLTGSVVCNPNENLITKAKKKLEEIIGSEFLCSIDLQKNIPVSSGLGGGSSNAASAIIGLNLLYNLNLDSRKMKEIALEVGSDVPFFCNGYGTAFVQGIGQHITPVEIKASEFYLIARPHIRISTKEMYDLHDKFGKSFFDIAKEKYPVIEELHRFFSQYSSKVGMSGSGPTIFAGFDLYNEAVEAIGKFGNFDGDFFICRPSVKTYEIVKTRVKSA